MQTKLYIAYFEIMLPYNRRKNIKTHKDSFDHGKNDIKCSIP